MRHMTDAEISRLTDTGSSGRVRRPDASVASGQFVAGFVSLGGACWFPIRDGIAELVPGSAIAFDMRPVETVEPLADEKVAVRDFYDTVGWKRTETGHFADTARFVDVRPIASEYIEACRSRAGRYLPRRGNYLLDVACGANPHSALTEAEAFEKIVCIDLSISALRSAREVLGDRGVYILGDVSNLPLRKECIDAVLSAHTIYHVPRDEQAHAIDEIYRVLKPGGSAVIIYVWPRDWSRRLREFRNGIRSIAPRVSPRTASPGAEPRLYFHAHPRKWFKAQDWPFGYEIVVWRSLGAATLRRFIHPRLAGRKILAVVYWLEDRLPHLAGRLGRYPMFVFSKPSPRPTAREAESDLGEH